MPIVQPQNGFLASVSILTPAGVSDDIGLTGAALLPSSLGIFLIGSTILPPGTIGVPWIGAGVIVAPPWIGAAGAGAQQLGAHGSQQITSQQSFFLRLNRLRRFGFSQQHGSQQAGWQLQVEPQQDAGAQAGAQQAGAQLGAHDVVQAGARLGVQQAGAQLTTSQQQSLHFLERLRFSFLQQGSQQSVTQQSQTAPQVPPQLPPHDDVEATGAACAAGAAGGGLDPTLTVVSSKTNTFTGVILRSYGTSATACPVRITPSHPGKWPAAPSYPCNSLRFRHPALSA
jgi:hypothetical protein